MQDKPKFIFNQGTRKFEGLDPEDDVKIEDLKKAKAASEINKFVKSTLPPEDKPADVYETNAALNKFRLPHDQLKPVYNKDIGTFVRGNKKGPLTDFKLRESFTRSSKLPLIFLAKSTKRPLILFIDKTVLLSESRYIGRVLYSL